MDTPTQILTDLRSRGLSFEIDEQGRLMAGPSALLSDDVRALIRANRDGLLAALAPEALDRAVLGRPPPGPAGRWAWATHGWRWVPWNGSAGSEEPKSDPAGVS